MAMRQVEGTDPAPNQVDQTPVRRGRAGGLLRRTFIIALVLVSGGLITSSAVELFFRYRESVEGSGACNGRWRGGRPSRYSSLYGTSSTRCGPARRNPTSWPPG